MNNFVLQPWLNTSVWKSIRTAVCGLAESLYKYAAYLKEKNLEIQRNHEKVVPVRSNSNAESYILIKKAIWTKPEFIVEFKSLQNELDRASDFELIFVNDLAPANQR